MSIPCEMCGAGADEPCEDDCPDMAYVHESEMLDREQAEEMSTHDLARQILFRATTGLPYSALAGDPPYFGEHTDDDQWLAEMAVWMANYNKVIREQVEDLQAQSRQRLGLQLEKDIIREFLGDAITEKLETLK